MKILIVNTYDRGGAANACLRLHEGLINEGVNSNVLFKNQQKFITNSSVIKPINKKFVKTQKRKYNFFSILKKLKLSKAKPKKDNDFLKYRNSNLELFSYPTSNYDITESPLYKEADIINLHWVAGLLDYKSFFKKNTKPVVWTLHDMNPFTGGEHYIEEINGIDELGFPIKRKKSEKEIEEEINNLSIKLSVIKEVANLTIVAPSVWLAEEAKNSEIFKNLRTHCIPYGINSDIYKPNEKKQSREILGIPKNKRVILFVADSISNHRKGFVYLKRALEKLEVDNLLLCTIGIKIKDLATSFNMLEFGIIKDEKKISMIYSAADVFVIPSLMDNLPNTVLESIMCGTPVIGFPVGGIPDMIQHNKNGLLTKNISVDSLVETINIFFSTLDKFDTNFIREDAIKKYDLGIQTTNYINLFESILRK